jgi:hypothetical protein
MKNFILMLIIMLTSFTFAQNSSLKCGNTNPQYCLNEMVYRTTDRSKSYLAKIVEVSSDKKIYTVRDEDDGHLTKYYASHLSKTEGCGKTSPKFCVNEMVYRTTNRSKSYLAKIVAVSSDKQIYTVRDEDDGHLTKYYASHLSKTEGCGNITPKFCINDKVERKAANGNYYLSKIVAVSTDKQIYTLSDEDDGYLTRYYASQLALISRPTSTISIDRLDPRISRDTHEITDAVKQLQSAVSEPRKKFLEHMTSGLSKQNNETVNIMAGLILSKIIKGLTAPIIKDNFEKEVDRFLSDEKTKGFENLDNIVLDSNTLDLASRVLFSAAALQESQLASTENSNLKQRIGLNMIDRKLSSKLIGLQNLCNESQKMIINLIESEKYSVFGQVTADICGWIANQ